MSAANAGRRWLALGPLLFLIAGHPAVVSRERTRGHLPGAEHASRGVLEGCIERLVPDSHSVVVLYCAGGARSVLAAQSLQEMGYTRVYRLEGGLRAWSGAGFPLAGVSSARSAGH